MALAGRQTRLGNHLEEPGAFTRPGFSMGSRQVSFQLAMLDEVLFEDRLERRVAGRKAARRLEVVEVGDEVAFDGGVQLFSAGGALSSPKVTLVAGLIFEVANAWHGAVDKRAIPEPAISKGEQPKRQNREIIRLAGPWNRTGA